MINLRIFNSMEEFESAKPSMETPFVVLENGTSTVIYSNLVEISEDDLTNGDFVDLDLPSGTKWATCNLGATMPCESGDYYMWGSTTPNTKDDCSSSNSPLYGINKSEWLDENNNLKPEFDAVSIATNGVAHMPTKGQMEELLANTEWCYSKCIIHEHTYAVYGLLCTSKTDSSKKLFIPKSGCRQGSSTLYTQDQDEFIWSSSYDSTSTSFPSYYLERRYKNVHVGGNKHYYGLPIRGVLGSILSSN